ncbi:hypothetical protein M0D48_13395 [Xanthomonas prunicola]|uniref:hypothetical protein n=1 Tax=Xanthomonas prunicola TaxID=2053930 RepID=UPI0021B4BE2E|nr:hypothetical protein [Xanthomonas prunicola]UXA60027.1 hypothetical protein M0D48_13395 [Xanthomonas prunicola]
MPEEKNVDGIVIHDAYSRNQIEALVKTANGIELKDNKSISISNLSWVHYLCQFQLGIEAVALSKIESHVLQSIESCKEVRLTLTSDKGVQLDLLLKSSCSQKADGWLDLPTLDDAGLPASIDLSALVELMPVVVAREGSGGPQLEFGMGIERGMLSRPLLDLQESTPVPASIKTHSM